MMRIFFSSLDGCWFVKSIVLRSQSAWIWWNVCLYKEICGGEVKTRFVAVRKSGWKKRNSIFQNLESKKVAMVGKQVLNDDFWLIQILVLSVNLIVIIPDELRVALLSNKAHIFDKRNGEFEIGFAQINKSMDKSCWWYQLGDYDNVNLHVATSWLV